MRTRSISLSALALVAVLVAVASPAQAAGRPLPDGWALTLVDCDGRPPTVAYRVDPPTAATSPIGAGSTLTQSTCALQGAWDPVSRQAYFVNDTQAGGVLVRLDLANGNSTEVGPFRDAAGDRVPIVGVAVSPDGSAFAFGRTGMRYVLDLVNGTTSAPISLAGLAGATQYGLNDVTAVAFDPVTGELFIVDADGYYTTNYLYEVTPEGRLVPLLQLVTDAGATVTSLQVDTDHVLWHLAENDAGTALWSTARFDGATAVRSGQLALPSAALIIAPASAAAPAEPTAPDLPATGPEPALQLLTALGVLVLGVAALCSLVLGVAAERAGPKRRP